MFGSPNLGANAYAKVSMETGVATASPHQLVLMLFEGAMVAITSATQSMQAGDIPAKGKAISKAINIIDNGLRASLNKQAGGEIAINLHELYEYMGNRLLLANLKNDPAVLNEVYQLLKGLKDAWQAIGDAPAPAVEAPAPTIPANSDPFAPHTSRLVKA
ncbi:MAG TPA: flagellar export chaperone FliS [Oxalobacteraceae bacterium]|nr:flagellar export chaperone FliS [Oxalobacteraceae bacterium]